MEGRTIDSYREYSTFYDAIYRNKDYVGEAKAVLALLETYGVGTAPSILDVGSGTGLHLQQLKKQGAVCSGVEPSPHMARLARQRGVKTRIGRLEDYEPGYLVDVCTALFAVTNYISPGGLGTFFAAARRQLKATGLVVLEMWSPDAPPPVTTEKTFHFNGFPFFRRVEVSSLEVGVWDLEIQILSSPGRNLVAAERHRIHKHSIDALQRASEMNGLEMRGRQPAHLNKNDTFHETYVFSIRTPDTHR